MDYSYVEQDIINAKEDIVVNASNGLGWMGGKIAQTTKRAGIAENINYATKGQVEKESFRILHPHTPGKTFFTNGYGIGRIGIIHAVTMLLPGCYSSYKTVKKLLPNIVALAEEKGAKSIAIPLLGCGTGRLNKNEVKKIYETFFDTCNNNITVVVYDIKKEVK